MTMALGFVCGVLLGCCVSGYCRMRQQVFFSFRRDLNFYLAYQYREMIEIEKRGKRFTREERKVLRNIHQAERFERHLEKESKRFNLAILFLNPYTLWGDSYVTIKHWKIAEKEVSQIGKEWERKDEEAKE